MKPKVRSTLNHIDLNILSSEVLRYLAQALFFFLLLLVCCFDDVTFLQTSVT